MTTPRHNWGLSSPACLVGALGATITATARLAQEASGASVKFMPLLSDMPHWLVADVTVIVAAIVGGTLGQLACALVAWIRQES